MATTWRTRSCSPGTHSGTDFHPGLFHARGLPAIPASGAAIEFTQTCLTRVEGGTMREMWEDFDRVRLFLQLGVGLEVPPSQLAAGTQACVWCSLSGRSSRPDPSFWGCATDVPERPVTGTSGRTSRALRSGTPERSVCVWVRPAPGREKERGDEGHRGREGGHDPGLGRAA